MTLTKSIFAKGIVSVALALTVLFTMFLFPMDSYAEESGTEADSTVVVIDNVVSEVELIEPASSEENKEDVVVPNEDPKEEPVEISDDITFNKPDDYTGVAKGSDGQWYRLVNGAIDHQADGIYKNEYGWWKTTDGIVTFKETGVFKNEYGWWRVEKSKVNFKATGIYKNTNGWWKTSNGKVTFKETGVYKNEHGWWRVENSKVYFNACGIYNNDNGWWYVVSGKVDFKFNGVSANEHGLWKLIKGKVDFNYNGTYKYRGISYSIKNGKVTSVLNSKSKRVLVLGDSLSSGWMINGKQVNAIKRSPPNIACNLMQASVQNESLASQTIAIGEGKYSISRDKIPKVDLGEYDTVVVAAGINDFFQSVPLGTLGSLDKKTFYGSLGVVFSAIEKENVKRDMKGKAPLRTVVYSIGFDFVYGKNSAELSIPQYNECISQSAKNYFHSTPYVISSFQALNAINYKSNTYDELHPNEKGVNAMALDYISSLA